MNEIEKIKDLMLRMGEYLPKMQYLMENKELLSEAHENIDTLLATRYKDIDKDTAMRLLLFDPTYQKGPLVKGEYPNPSKKAGNYGVWILDRYLNGEITLNDGDKVYKTLNVFKNIGKRLKNSNINAYSSFQELYDEVLPFINGEKNMNTHSAMVDKYRHIPDTEIPYEDDFWLVVTPFNEEASCQVGGGTKWCTASRESVNRFWRYAVHTPLFVIINKSENGMKYQYNTWSKEFKDVQNEKANMDSVDLSPKLLKWLKDGADEYKEKYLQEIKPYEKERIQQINQRLANGEDPKKIFNEVGEFEDGFARIKLDGKGWNYLTLDRTLLWHGNTWFDECDDFKKGFVLVQYEGEWCYLTQSGDLISMEQYIQQIETRLSNGEDPKKIFDWVGEFVNGFARVELEGNGWNFLKEDGTLLWHKDTWFTTAYDFKNGFALVYYKGKDCYLTQSDDLIPIEQYIQQIEPRLANGEDPKKIFDEVRMLANGFAKVELKGKGWNYLKPDNTLLWHGDTWFYNTFNFKNGFAKVWFGRKGYNYLKPDGTLLWHGDTWFEIADDFKNGYAKVEYKGEWCYLTQNGDLASMKQYIQQIEQRLTNGEDPNEIFDEVGKFVNGFAIVSIEKKGWNFIKKDGTLLWHGDTWFDNAYNFENGFAAVWFGRKGFNYLKPDGALLWNGDTWFDDAEDFKNGLAKVDYNDEWYNLDTKGLLHKRK